MIRCFKLNYKMALYSVFILLSVLPILTKQQCLTADDSKDHTDPQARLTLFRGEQQFSISLLQMVNSMKPHTNIFFSPYSIHQAMVLAYFVSANHTEEEIKKGIFLPETQDKLSTMQAYRLEKFFQSMRALNGSSGYEFINVNRLFVSDKQKVKDCMEELFKDEIEKLDFTKSLEAASHINKWVSNQTRGLIDKLIPEESLSDDSQLVLTNAAYFKGLWKSKFDKKLTKKEIFYINSRKNAFVTMMKVLNTFNYAISETLGAHILELPYKGDDVSMFVLLPPFASPIGITNVLERLNLKTLQEIIDGDIMSPRPIIVQFPKFSMEKTIELPPILESVGIKIFTKSADFSSLTGDRNISMNDGIHKAKIQIDEDGTEAAAATALFSFRSSRPLDPVEFICNHPFIYFMYDRVSQTILFAGIYNSPEPEE